MKEFKHKIGKNEFKLLCNEESILDSIDKLKGEWEEYRYTELYTCEEGNVNKTDFLKDVSDLKKSAFKYINNEELIKDLIEKFPKKEDGSFNNRRIKTINNTCYVCEYYSDFSNAWKIKTLVVLPINDRTLELILREEFYKY